MRDADFRGVVKTNGTLGKVSGGFTELRTHVEDVEVLWSTVRGISPLWIGFWYHYGSTESSGVLSQSECATTVSTFFTTDLSNQMELNEVTAPG